MALPERPQGGCSRVSVSGRGPGSAAGRAGGAAGGDGAASTDTEGLDVALV